MRIQTILPCLLFIVALQVNSAEQQITIDGFQLGMNKSEASKLKPEATWQPFGRSPTSHSAQKEFLSTYMGLPARVKITLNRQGDVVSSIGIIVPSKDRAACSNAAKQAFSALEASLGKAREVATTPVARAVWTNASGTTSMWFNSCENEPPEYTITHTRRAS